MPDNLGAPLDYSGLPPDVLAGLQLVNLGPGLPSQPAIQQHPAAQAQGAQAAGAPDLATALRQLVQIASTPQHPDQQTALRHLVHLAILHHALGGGQGVTSPRTTTAPTPPAQ